MIECIEIGSITSPNNPRDIIIGMNTALREVNGIGRRFVRDKIPQTALDLGSVLTYNFDDRRKLHMIICHRLGQGGWQDADRYVRFGMDYLEHFNDSGRSYSIVEIGTGRIGVRDKADSIAIRKAMMDSFLPVVVYKYDGIPAEAMVTDRPPLRLMSAWSVAEGPLQVAA